MKRVFSLLISVIMAFTSIFISFAHGGKTDSSGGHRDNKNKSGLGSYHYHCGGTPAHLHTNGVCPYKTNTGNKSNPSSNNSSSTKSKSNTATVKNTSQKSIVTEENTYIYEHASTDAPKLATVKEGYIFTHTGSTKSFWKMKFKKHDGTVHVGYILKKDTKLITN